MRGIAELAIVASCIAVTALPAYAVPRGAIVLADDQPVVRQPAVAAPVVRTPRTTTAPGTTRLDGATPAGSGDRAISVKSANIKSTRRPDQTVTRRRVGVTCCSRSHPPCTYCPAVPRAGSTRVVVRPGDNLWLIARARLEHVSGVRPTDAQVARYWSAVIAANRATLRSGDPSLIYPGEIVALPPARAMP